MFVCVCMCVLEQVASTEADLVGLKQQLGVFMGRMDKEICSKADIQALQVRWLVSFYQYTSNGINLVKLFCET